MTIVELPTELLAHVFEFLSPEETCKLSQICKTFHSTSQIDTIWETKCSELPIPRFSIQNDQLSFRQIYTKVLHKYWKLLGFWQRDVTWYGGLLHVKFDPSNGRIVGTDWNPSNYVNVRSPMSGSPAFCVLPDSYNVVNCCPRGQESQHCCQIALGNSIDDKVEEFRTECLAPVLHDSSHEDGMQADLNMGQEMTILRKFDCISSHRGKYDYSRLEWPLPVPSAIIEPGLFKGDYDLHGVELIMLTYVDERAVEGVKVTGDPNIPAGRITFGAHLLEPFVMNVEEQANIFGIMRAQPLSPPIPLNQLPEQPFRLPDQIFSHQLDLPNVCKARFHGLGQIASEDYSEPSFIPGHWIIFNENLFGFIWFKPRLPSFSLFHRVLEEF